VSSGEFLDGVRTYLQQGGFVMWPLAAATLVLWYALGYRLVTLRRGSRRSARVLLESYSQGSHRAPRGIVDTAVVWGLALVARNPGLRTRPMLDDAFGELRRELASGRVAIRSIVSAAPLTGLLGTVIGMIETFDSIGDMALFAQSGGIAGGISQALFTTQMGLAVAVPGIVAGRILDRRQSRVEQELDQIKDWLSADFTAAAQLRARGD
jgi:biopolymer transport protein ExbB